MAQTIPGGAYLTGDGQIWRNAKGDLLTKAQISEAGRVLGQQQAQIAEAEQQRLLTEAQRDPAARAIAAALQPGVSGASQPENKPST